MNKTAFFLTLALLTAQYSQVKPGFITTTIGAAVIAAAAVYTYVQWKESQETDSDKIINSAANTAKESIKKIKESIKN
jgi:hypothetical protein